MNDASWSGMVVVCAGTPWDGVPMSERQIANQLTTWAPVLFVDPPRSVQSLRGKLLQSQPLLRMIRPRLAHLTPIVLPGSRSNGMVRLTEALTRWQINSAIARLGGSASFRILASDLPVYDLSREERRVLFATDDFLAGADLMGLPRAQIMRHEARLAAESEIIVAISDPLADKWRNISGKVVVVPNGCDAARFALTDKAPWPQDVRLIPPIVGFAGQINDRLDLSLLEAVVARGHSLLLVGPVTQTFDRARLDALLCRPNVQWLGAKPFEAMPGYLRTMHVGLTPYTDTPFNRASLPLKTIEYLAAGRAAVSTDLPASRWLKTGHVSLAVGPRQFADAVDLRIAEPLTDSIIAARRQYANQHSWAARAHDFASAINLEMKPDNLNWKF